MTAPCPFCGGDQITTWYKEQNRKPWVAECWDCNAQGPHAETEAEAIDRWNARPKE